MNHTIDATSLQIEDLLSNPGLRGALLYQAQRGDRAAQALISEHDAAWRALELSERVNPTPTLPTVT